ncbi:MAG: twin-arginine translocase TatA/TatE family subunit [Nitrospinota bacterium]|nr:twin-arginine translocase TatA/TatE family subunit [Nitrospinota bacterium]
MFGIGFTEMAIILVIALVILGPAKLPEIARSMGKGYAEFIRSMRDVREEVERAAMTVEEEKKIFNDPAAMVGRIVETTFPPEKAPAVEATAENKPDDKSKE